jgi:hypothetical protein
LFGVYACDVWIDQALFRDGPVHDCCAVRPPSICYLYIL